LHYFEGRQESIIDTFLQQGQDPLSYQYLADFTTIKKIRLSADTTTPLYLFYSHDLTAALAPDDYAPLSTPGGTPTASLTEPGEWLELPQGAKTLIRLTLSTQPSNRFLGLTEDACAMLQAI